MHFETVIYGVDDGIARVTMNRPERHNAMSRRLKADLTAAIAAAAADPVVRVVVLSGAGRSFSSGIDLQEGADDPFAHTAAAWRRHLESSLALCWSVWSCPKPVIAAVRGYALGAGCDLALSADIAVATPDARFGEPEIADSSGPPTLMMPWVVGLRKAKELLLTGDAVTGEEALRIGMVNRVFAEPAFEAGVAGLAARITRSPATAVELNKRTINKTFEIMGLRSSLELNQEYMISIALARSEAEREARLARIRTEGLSAVLKAGNADA